MVSKQPQEKGRAVLNPYRKTYRFMHTLSPTMRESAYFTCSKFHSTYLQVQGALTVLPPAEQEQPITQSSL
jgi:hypothetical protein